MEKCLFSTLILKSRNRLFLLQTVRIIIAYRKPYQHPFAIACFECCDNIIKIKLSFPDKAKQNNLLTVDAVRSSIASSFNKCFFVNSPWHCASFTKQKALNNPQTRSGMPLKKTVHLFLTLGSFWYLYKDANELFEPNASKQTFYQSTWPENRLEYEHKSLYFIQCKQDSGRDCNLYLFLAWRDTRIQHDQVSAVSDETPVGCRCDALGVVFMQTTGAIWHHLDQIGSKMSRFLRFIT